MNKQIKIIFGDSFISFIYKTHRKILNEVIFTHQYIQFVCIWNKFNKIYNLINTTVGDSETILFQFDYRIRLAFQPINFSKVIWVQININFQWFRRTSKSIPIKISFDRAEFNSKQNVIVRLRSIIKSIFN